MARIFWVTCPRCGARFYALYEDFRETGRPLMCHLCGSRFTDKEARIEE